MIVGFYVLMFVIGACFGSFLCCQARRLHIYTSPKHKTSAKSKSSTKTKKTDTENLGHRSICLHCSYQLKWYDNLPIISWLILRGKCRHCHKKIGLAELLSELGLGIAFLLLSLSINPFLITPLEWTIFIVTLMLTIVLSFLAIYDGLYGELPSYYLITSIILASILLVLKIIAALSIAPFTINIILNPFFSVIILGGLYLTLYLVSKGKWVGDGDWLLGLAIGLALASPWLALITLFLANLLACLVMYRTVKTNRKARIHLGPFLVAAFVIVYAFSAPLSNIMIQ